MVNEMVRQTSYIYRRAVIVRPTQTSEENPPTPSDHAYESLEVAEYHDGTIGEPLEVTQVNATQEEKQMGLPDVYYTYQWALPGGESMVIPLSIPGSVSLASLVIHKQYPLGDGRFVIAEAIFGKTQPSQTHSKVGQLLLALTIIGGVTWFVYQSRNKERFMR
jgi:hypothetical protein